MIDDALLDDFARAQELAGAEREAFLAAVAERDGARARELRELLAAAAPPASLLERAPYGLEPMDDAEPLPERIGPYNVLREIGRGGMGRVYLAEQRGDGFARRVAVKRLDQWKASPASARRFRDEVTFLASLEHPGIARFLDGGRAADGSAYLALEYIEGADLLAHAAGRGLSVEARLRLFLEVLDAVAFAHARHIVHRDLKPGNVLVGADGHPKLLDFGISKLVDPQGDGAVTTQTELRALTPAYASPEQIRGEKVTAASDVYSLGVVLYELLAGVHPFRARSSDAHALVRAVLEEDPEPPSTAARRSTRDEPDAARREPTTAAGTFRLGRDLDAICLKALRKEPAQRYASVTALADDVRRFLDGLPVAARRGGLSYRLAKGARRYRVHLAVAATAALVATALVLLTVRALDDGGRVTAPRVAAPTGPRPTLSRIGELSARFAEQPTRPEIGLELIAALLAAGRGKDAMAAVTRLRQLPDPLGKGPRIDLAEAEAALAVSEYQRAAALATSAEEGAVRARDEALARRARLAQARALLRLSSPQEVDSRAAALVTEAEKAGDEQTAVEGLVLRALAARRAAHADEARRLVEAALPRARALGDRRSEVEAMTLSARLQGESGAVDEGLRTVDRAIAIAVESGDIASEAGALLIKMALLNWGGKDQATVIATGKLAVQRLRLSGDREQLLRVLANFATQYIEQAELREAEAVITEAEPLADALGSPRHRATVLRARGYLEEQRGDRAAARASYTAALAAGREAGVDSVVANNLEDLAWLEVEDRRPDAAAAAATESVELFRRGGDERSAIEAGAALACADVARGKGMSAKRRLATLAAAAAQSDSDSAKFVVLTAEARVAQDLGERARAVELYRKAVEMAKGLELPGVVLNQQGKLAVALDRAGDRDAAVALAREVLPRADRLGFGGVVRDCRQVLDRIPAAG
ncbi:MAG TPA: serine/threonine-protein kinase [Thermoanaerobaculia bacterium]|nr:serine/threonine-protein kinase [Thermoanaerobaculia bacterium]